MAANPTTVATGASVTVNEGDTANNTGTFADINTGDSLVVDGGLTIQLQEDFGVRQVKYALEHPGISFRYQSAPVWRCERPLPVQFA